MRHPRRGWLLGIAAVALAASCEQTLHLFPTVSDGGGAAGTGGSAGANGIAGRGGRFGSGGTGGNIPFDGGAPDGRCFGPPAVVTFTPDAPQMVIALDRSTSMNQPFVADSQNSPTHLNAAISDLGGQIYQYTNPRSDHPQIGFFYVSFPDYMSGCPAQSGCCSSDAAKDWTIFWQGVASCSNPSATCVTSANRPIAAALQKATAVLTGSNSAHAFQRYLVLVTDGSPKSDCSQNDCATAQTQISMMAGQGIKVRVVGIGDQSAIGTCPKNLVTAAGDLGQYYAAATDTDLQTTLGQVMADAVCAVTLNTPLSSANNLQVSLNGPLGFNSPDGWSYDNMGHVRLHGAACSTYAAKGSQSLFITNGCEMGRGGSGSTPP